MKNKKNLRKAKHKKESKERFDGLGIFLIKVHVI